MRAGCYYNRIVVITIPIPYCYLIMVIKITIYPRHPINNHIDGMVGIRIVNYNNTVYYCDSIWDGEDCYPMKIA